MMSRTRTVFSAVACLVAVGLIVGGCASSVRSISSAPGSAMPASTAAELSVKPTQQPSSSARPIADVAYVATAKHVVALTFDDGPDPRWTSSVLRILRNEHATATFFVLGPAVLRHPDLVRAERDQGTEVGCHGWSHVLLMNRPLRALLDDYRRCVDAVHAVAGIRTTIVRPPYGLLMPSQFRALRDAGYSPVVWDVSAAPLTHPTLRVRTLMQLVHPGSIVLLHDGRRNRQHELRALPLLIRGLRARGFTFVTVTQLLGDGHPVAEPAQSLERRYCFRTHQRPTCAMPGLDVSAR